MYNHPGGCGNSRYGLFINVRRDRTLPLEYVLSCIRRGIRYLRVFQLKETIQSFAGLQRFLSSCASRPHFWQRKRASLASCPYESLLSAFCDSAEVLVIAAVLSAPARFVLALPHCKTSLSRGLISVPALLYQQPEPAKDQDQKWMPRSGKNDASHLTLFVSIRTPKAIRRRPLAIMINLIYLRILPE